MPKETNRTKTIKEKLLQLLTQQAEWDCKRLRKACIDDLGAGDAKERARLGNSIRRVLTQLVESNVILLDAKEGVSAGPRFELLVSEVSEMNAESQESKKNIKKTSSTPEQNAMAKKPKEKDMRLFLAELFEQGERGETEIVKLAVERFRVQGERIHGVRGLALQVLKALESEGVIVSCDGRYRLTSRESEPIPEPALERPMPKKAKAVKVQRAVKSKQRASLTPTLSAGVPLDEKSFASLLNAQGGDFFNVFVAKLLDLYYASVGVHIAGRFVVDGSEDKGIDVILHTRDELGISDKVAVQAKTRARSQITLKELREFYGCVHAESATRGLFITTTTFTTEAVEFLLKSPDLGGIDAAKLFALACRFEIGIVHRDGKPYAAPELIGR